MKCNKHQLRDEPCFLITQSAGNILKIYWFREGTEPRLSLFGHETWWNAGGVPLNMVQHSQVQSLNCEIIILKSALKQKNY